eukprot:s2941_g7.t1
MQPRLDIHAALLRRCCAALASSGAGIGTLQTKGQALVSPALLECNCGAAPGHQIREYVFDEFHSLQRTPQSIFAFARPSFELCWRCWSAILVHLQRAHDRQFRQFAKNAMPA